MKRVACFLDKNIFRRLNNQHEPFKALQQLVSVLTLLYDLFAIGLAQVC